MIKKAVNSLLSSAVLTLLLSQSIFCVDEDPIIKLVKSQVSSYTNQNRQAIHPIMLRKVLDNANNKGILGNENALSPPSFFQVSWEGHLGEVAYRPRPANVSERAKLNLREGREKEIKIYSQMGSTCVVYAVCSAIDYLGVFTRSPRFAYYQLKGGELNHDDVGAWPRNLLGQISIHGICSKELWDFKNDDVGANGKIKPEAFAVPPSYDAEQDARNNKIIGLHHIGLYSYNISPVDRRLINLGVLVDYLDNYKLPILCALNIDLKAWNSLFVPSREAEGSGRHAVLVTGYDFSTQTPYFRIQNSWGSEWGTEGEYFIDFDSFSKMAEPEFWQITKIGRPYKSINEQIEKEVVIPFAKRLGSNIDNIDYFALSELYEACLTDEILDIKEAANFIFNKNFLIKDAEIVDYAFILNTFIRSKDSGKDLNQYRTLYLSLIQYGFEFSDLKRLCFDGYDDWYKLKKFIGLFRKMGIDRQAFLATFRAALAAYSDRDNFFLEFIKSLREDLLGNILRSVQPEVIASTLFPGSLISEQALLEMPVFSKLVTKQNPIPFKGLELVLPGIIQQDSLKLQIVQKFGGEISVFYDDGKKPILDEHSQPVRYQYDGSRLARLSQDFETLSISGSSSVTPPGSLTPITPLPVPSPFPPVNPTPVPSPFAPVKPLPVPNPFVPVNPSPAPSPFPPVNPTPAPSPFAPVKPLPVPNPFIPVNPTPVPNPFVPVNPFPLPNLFTPISPLSTPSRVEPQVIINSGFTYDNFRHLLNSLLWRHDKSYITMLAGYSGLNGTRDFNAMFSNPTYYRWNQIVQSFNQSQSLLFGKEMFPSTTPFNVWDKKQEG